MLDHPSAKELASYDYDGNGDVHAIIGEEIDGIFYPTPDSLLNRVDRFQPASGIVSDADCNPDRKGYKTGERLCVLSPDNDTKYVSRRFYYDRKGRLIQTLENNFLGGISRISIKYDFRGNIRTQHETYSTSIDGPEDVLLRGYAYDDRGRVVLQSTRLNENLPTIIRYRYDELGRVSTTSTGLFPTDTTKYAYNLQGWLTKQTSQHFSMELRYYDPVIPGTTPSYTGNITEWEWTNIPSLASKSDIYTFEYDALSRLKNTEHTLVSYKVDTTEVSRDTLHVANEILQPSRWIDLSKLPQTEKSISYDLNGNITSMSRYRGSARTEYVAYLYTNNRLKKIIPGIDPILPPFSASDVYEPRIPADSGYIDVPVDSTIYHYNPCGFVTFDPVNKLSLSYNRLNLLEKLNRNETTLAKYSYLWDGTKLRAVDSDGNGLCYLGSLVYRQESNVINSGEFDPNLRNHSILSPYSYSLESAGFEGGRIVAVNTSSGKVYTPHYYVTDHLGSVRVVVDENRNVLERSDYLPYGKRWVGGQLSDNRYRYNGKEEQAFVDNPYLDYGARMYDPDNRLSWTGPDPLAEKYYAIFPYTFCAGNPINFIDPNGMDWYSYWEFERDENGNITSGRRQYKYIEDSLTEEEILKRKYTFEGRTILTDNTYFSLGGAIINYDKNNPFSVMGLKQIIDADRTILGLTEAMDYANNFWNNYNDIISTGSDASTLIGKYLDMSKGFRNSVSVLGGFSTLSQVYNTNNNPFIGQSIIRYRSKYYFITRNSRCRNLTNIL